MRIRAMIAALAVACSLALCAVPAFADDIETVEVELDPSLVTITYSVQGNHNALVVGSYSGDGGIYLVCIGAGQAPNEFWQLNNSGSYVNTTVPASQGTFFLSPEDGDYARVASYYLDDAGVRHYVRVIFRVTHWGTDNDMTGVFGVTSSTIGNVINWVKTWIDGILDEPVLLFFCLALGLLTIGITVGKRLLAVRV